MARILAILAILLGMAIAAPAAGASELNQRGHPGVSVGGNWHHGGHVGVGFRHPGFGFRGPGFGFAPFLPVVALPPPVVAIPVQVPVPVPQYAPAYAPPQVNYAPALPAAPCGCPTAP